jgi:F-type H+-transporting ATPase subunit b
MPIAFLAAEAGGSQNPLFPAYYDIIWSAVVFVIVLVLFVWKVVPRLNRTLDARTNAIEGGIKRAEEAQAQAEATRGEYEAQLNEARAEAARIREQARTDGQKIVAEAREKAQAEADRVTAQAQQQIEAERQSALVSLRAEVGTLAIDLASGVVGESLADDAKASSLVDRFLADLEASDTARA